LSITGFVGNVKGFLGGAAEPGGLGSYFMCKETNNVFGALYIRKFPEPDKI